VNNSKELYLTTLRDKNATPHQFRTAATQLAQLLAYDTVNHIKTKKIAIETPNAATTGSTFAQDIVLIPILRSGITMLPSFLFYFEQATVGVVGLKRDETTAQAQWYYCNLPPLTANQQIIILDPMLATGGTGVEVLKKLQQIGVRDSQVLYVSMIAAPEGLHHIKASFPAVTFINAAIDQKLNTKKFIIPGLGDFGDRYFGTL